LTHPCTKKRHPGDEPEPTAVIFPDCELGTFTDTADLQAQSIAAIAMQRPIRVISSINKLSA